MKILLPSSTTNYRLIDSGQGQKLEQFGSNTIIRPDNTCLWNRHESSDVWTTAQATYVKQSSDAWGWQKKKLFKEPWLFSYQLPAKGSEKAARITCQLRLSTSKNIGIFPEQAAQWDWMAKIIQSVKHTPQVLNLFGYTGAATLVAAAAGAQVCHVDASQAAITLARANQALSKLENASIRWIVDDCATFVNREIKRKVQYDGIIIDPPAFGRDQKGKVFAFEKHIIELLGLCTQALKPKPLFIIFNGYAMGHSAVILKNILNDFYPEATIEYGELHVAEYGGARTLPCSIFARINFRH
jgi:23S rRNA (cytosine1962-C5)-methyltransferase